MQQNYQSAKHHRQFLGERALWRAVITQALMDASSQSKKKEMFYDKHQALHWLQSGGEDFKTVCDFAGLDPHYVREQAILALQRGCQWRVLPQKEKSRTKQQELV